MDTLHSLGYVDDDDDDDGDDDDDDDDDNGDENDDNDDDDDRWRGVYRWILCTPSVVMPSRPRASQQALG